MLAKEPDSFSAKASLSFYSCYGGQRIGNRAQQSSKYNLTYDTNLVFKCAFCIWACISSERHQWLHTICLFEIICFHYVKCIHKLCYMSKDCVHALMYYNALKCIALFTCM